MIYRIDRKHFLTHAIDYFTLDELRHFQYAIVSSQIANQGTSDHVVKLNDLYPLPDVVIEYAETHNKEILEKRFMSYLDPDEKTRIAEGDDKFYWLENIIYRAIVQNFLNHVDVMLISGEDAENDYMDIICKYLKKKFKIEVIDLNKLFKEGRVGPIYIDRDEIRDRAVDIRRAAARELMENKAKTRDGKLMLINGMSKKDKLKKLKELGVKIRAHEIVDIDKILIEAWCDDESD